MPEIQIRPAEVEDIPTLISIDHDYVSDHAWQMDIVNEEGQVSINFRQIHLPRSVRVEYPRSPRLLEQDWDQRSGLLVAVLEEQVIGYICLMQNMAPRTAWVTDLAVLRRARRQGVGSTLVLSGQEWAQQHGDQRMVLEMQPKNHPAICMANKLGFDFCGYNDLYYANRDIGLFFGKSLR